jgi:hypothetical protein
MRIYNRKLAQRIEESERMLNKLRVARRGEISEVDFLAAENELEASIADDEKTPAFTGYDRKGNKVR